MPRLRYRSASGSVLAGLIVLLVGSDVAAEEPLVSASMTCDPVREPGRVKCSVEARSTGGRSLAWADVALIDLPDFTSALKGRIGPSDSTSRDANGQKWAFGLIARRAGEGPARARVRAVVCEAPTSDAGASRCVPLTVEVVATVHVG